MRKLAVISLLIILVAWGGFAVGLRVVRSPDTGLGLLAGAVVASIFLAIVAREQDDRRFMIRLFLLAIFLRWAGGLALTYMNLPPRIAPDFATYDYFGDMLCRTWQGFLDPSWIPQRIGQQRSGWGMYYYVASVYYLLGRNLLVIQLINCAFGAYACVLVYKITRLIHPQPRVSRLAAILSAVSPSMILWSAQALKEAPIMLCLCLCAYFTLKLCRRFDLISFAFLLISLLCLYSLRHYVFIVIFIAIAGALLFTVKRFTPARTMQGMGLIIIIAFTFTYFGADEVAQKSLDLKRIQSGREWGAKASSSGFGANVDITDTRAALTYLPIGILYVLFAPFPWMVRNAWQVAMLPEMVLWWAAFPLLVKGYWVAFRRKLRVTLPITIFTVGLTLAYALFQTNVGTVHRQRAQIFVFFFIFISIGWELRREANERLKNRVARRRSRLPRFVPSAVSGSIVGASSAAETH